MSRSGYVDDGEYLELYRATVNRTIKGKKGQAFLKEMASAMDSMPERILIQDELIDQSGSVCALGSVCKTRNLDTSKIDYEDPESVANALGISRSLAAEIEYMNDEYLTWRNETLGERWLRMRKWISENIVEEVK